MNKLTKSKINIAIKEISDFCTDNHNSDFSCEYRLIGHVDWVQVKITSSCKKVGVFDPDFASFKNEDHSEKWLNDLLIKMKLFKEFHDDEFSPEKVAESILERKKDKLISLRRQVDSLSLEIKEQPCN